MFRLHFILLLPLALGSSVAEPAADDARLQTSPAGGLGRWFSGEVRTLEERRAGLLRELAALPQPAAAPTSARLGWHTRMLRSPDEPVWVQVDLGRRVPVEAIALVPAHGAAQDRQGQGHLGHRGPRPRRERPGDDSRPRPSFSGMGGTEATRLLGGFLAGRPLHFSSSRESAADIHVITDGADGKLSRGLVTIVPERFGTLDCGRLTVALPAGVAAKNWSAHAVNYSTEKPPQVSAITLSRSGDALIVPVNQTVSGAWMLMFAEDPATLPKP